MLHCGVQTLRLIKFAAGKAGSEFRREIQRQAAVIRNLLHYKWVQWVWTIHFNELYISHWNQVWLVTCGPTFSQSWAVRQDHDGFFMKHFTHAKRGACPRWVAQMDAPVWPQRVKGNSWLRYSVRDWDMIQTVWVTWLPNPLLIQQDKRHIDWITLSIQTCQSVCKRRVSP